MSVSEDVKFALDKKFESELQDWFNSTTSEERAKSSRRFPIGKTTEVLKSIDVKDADIYFGEVYTESNKPVMISLLVNPKNKNGENLNYAVITSAYGRRTSNLQNLINQSRIYYVCDDKKSTYLVYGVKAPIASCGSNHNKC